MSIFHEWAGGMRSSCKRMPTKLCMMVEAAADHPGVPAFCWSWHGAKPRTPTCWSLFMMYTLTGDYIVLCFSPSGLLGFGAAISRQQGNLRLPSGTKNHTVCPGRLTWLGPTVGWLWPIRSVSGDFRPYSEWSIVWCLWSRMHFECMLSIHVDEVPILHCKIKHEVTRRRRSHKAERSRHKSKFSAPSDSQCSGRFHFILNDHLFGVVQARYPSFRQAFNVDGIHLCVGT